MNFSEKSEQYVNFAEYFPRSYRSVEEFAHALAGLPSALGPHQDHDLGDVGAGAQQFLHEHLAHEAGGPRHEDGPPREEVGDAGPRGGRAQVLGQLRVDAGLQLRVVHVRLHPDLHTQTQHDQNQLPVGTLHENLSQT